MLISNTCSLSILPYFFLHLPASPLLRVYCLSHSQYSHHDMIFSCWKSAFLFFYLAPLYFQCEYCPTASHLVIIPYTYFVNSTTFLAVPFFFFDIKFVCFFVGQFRSPQFHLQSPIFWMLSNFMLYLPKKYTDSSPQSFIFPTHHLLEFSITTFFSICPLSS